MNEELKFRAAYSLLLLCPGINDTGDQMADWLTLEGKNVLVYVVCVRVCEC